MEGIKTLPVLSLSELTEERLQEMKRSEKTPQDSRIHR